MKTTVVIATLGRSHLTDQLGALAGQTRHPDQVVVVNNGVPGAADEAIKKWRAELPTLELVEDRSLQTVAYARNVGAERARFEGLLFLDDDDVVDPDYVAAVASELERADLVAARIDVDALNSRRLRAGWGDMQSDGPMTYHDFLPWSSGCALSIRREIFRRVGGFDERLSVTEDTDLCWRVQLAGGLPIVFAPGAVVRYRLRDRPGPAFRQARQWAVGEAQLAVRFAPYGLAVPSFWEPLRWRELRRWARPAVLLLTARSGDDLVGAARSLGGCVGRLKGALYARRPAVRIEVRSAAPR